MRFLITYNNFKDTNPPSKNSTLLRSYTETCSRYDGSSYEIPHNVYSLNLETLNDLMALLAEVKSDELARSEDGDVWGASLIINTDENDAPTIEIYASNRE